MYAAKQGIVCSLDITMDRTTAVGYGRARSPSDRFIGVFSPPSRASAISSSSATADELNEDDVFFTDCDSLSDPPRNRSSTVNHRFRLPDKFGVLVALPESHQSRPDVVIQKSAFPRDIPSIPKPAGNKYSQSMPPIRRFEQSAPVNMPMMPRKPSNGDDEVDDEEMLPPHEIVARGSLRIEETTTFSVLEGAGRTLKGRDLRRVRNAVLRRTGFLD